MAQQTELEQIEKRQQRKNNAILNIDTELDKYLKSIGFIKHRCSWIAVAEESKSKSKQGMLVIISLRTESLDSVSELDND